MEDVSKYSFFFFNLITKEQGMIKYRKREKPEPKYFKNAKKINK